MKNKYKVVFIDWDKTLSISRFWEHWKDTEHNRKYEEVQNLFSDKGLIQNWMIGRNTAEDIAEKLAKMISVDSAFVFNELKSSVQKMIISKPALKKIKILRNKGIKVVIATDNMDTFTRWTVPALELDKEFDGILNSFDLKALKADKDHKGNSKFFQKFLENNQLRPGESVLIDDSENNAIVNDFGIDYLRVIDFNSDKHLDSILKAI